MMDDRRDERFVAWLREAAQEYHPPRPTPRDVMWGRLQAARAARRRIVQRPWLRWGVGIAAVLVLGIAIGRFTARPPSSPTQLAQPTQAAGPAPSDVAYQLAATQVFSRSEALLTGFRADSRRGGRRLDPQFALQARDLLSSTRLMLDSPAGDDPRLRALLEDLELVLAQIAQLSAERGTQREEVNLITQGLEQRGMLSRLRTAIPAGPAPARTEGAL